ncbi:hypothetical protein CFBP498_40210 [Xanthomonas hortorum pv. vitians]|uniref:Uncharacterized protein n=2 Tax=Xanthomonas hortorum TaxID=56454 RepID=A0A6V7EX30_9XANT|nr:hypothetical protein NCPPB940_14270 [Xanthomonas hortorum pv. taraxaci]CAD0322593.1 hypothetical protein CFBP8129_17040 [Xanthomonas hortorum pv. gardneri]CAD0355674.1 hypothetical protein CFBP498_40210 [Xanthomonas hortorum pv. vitians]CAD0317574.1 hypothetical protein NCPPB940_14270 [Xanthomonas hortorum pv. taraxaci]CAD0322600.1 hypothetical protein CFBP8129_17040 [Xanthomonas hortorum pv. gardneri]
MAANVDLFDSGIEEPISDAYLKPLVWCRAARSLGWKAG